MDAKLLLACALCAWPLGLPSAAAREASAGNQTAMVAALKAQGPNESLDGAASAFGSLVGSWDLTCDRYASDGTHARSQGVWHFGWIIDGRMMQDVIYFFPQRRPGERVGGTTLRLYDTQARQWRVTFFAPARNAVISLTGGLSGNAIVLTGVDVDGSPLRWSFNDITPKSFYWKGEISADGGKTWRVEQEMHLTRQRLPST